MYKLNDVLKYKRSKELFKIVSIGPKKYKNIDDKLTIVREITLQRVEYSNDNFNMITKYDCDLKSEYEKIK